MTTIYNGRTTLIVNALELVNKTCGLALVIKWIIIKLGATARRTCPNPPQKIASFPPSRRHPRPRRHRSYPQNHRQASPLRKPRRALSRLAAPCRGPNAIMLGSNGYGGVRDGYGVMLKNEVMLYNLISSYVEILDLRAGR